LPQLHASPVIGFREKLSALLLVGHATSYQFVRFSSGHLVIDSGVLIDVLDIVVVQFGQFCIILIRRAKLRAFISGLSTITLHDLRPLLFAHPCAGVN